MEEQRLLQMAQIKGWITPEQLARAQDEQQALADRGVEHSLWFLVQDLGFVSDDQARELRKHTSSTRIRALEVDGYIIQSRLGSGGMGDVFRARHRDGRQAAVKLLSARFAHHQEHRRRFAREARAMLGLHHEHIVEAYATGEIDGTPWLAMELVEGPSLKQWLIDHGSLPRDLVLVMLRQIASALQLAARDGILHRDVKPANIILGQARPGRGEPFAAKLCDFGLAKVGQRTGEDTPGQLTGSGLALGTPHYMSPEQASGDHDLDQRCDIYGLAATAYHALLGQTMHSGKSSAVIMYKQVTEGADLGLLRRVGIDEPLVVILGEMLEIDRARRTGSWELVLHALDRLDPRPGIAVAWPEEHQPLTLKSDRFSIPTARPAGPIAAPIAPAAAPVTQSMPHPAPAMAEPSAIEAKMSAAALIAPFTDAAARRPRSRPGLLWAVVLALAASLLIVALAMLFLALRRPAVAATPQTLAAILDEPRRDAVVLLAPGRYAGPVRLGISQSGAVLRAAGPGVYIDGGAQPALRCEPGLARAVVEGIELASTGCAVEILAGSALSLNRVVVRGGETAIDVSGGTLDLTGVRVIATGTALRFNLAERIALVDVDLTGAVGLTVDHCDRIALERVSIHAIRIGIIWDGSRPGAAWSGLSVHAPQPLQGLDGVATDGSGPRPGSLP